MKNWVHDAPVKIIQILPVDNDSSNQPLKPSDFSFFRNLLKGIRQTVARTTTALQPKDGGQEHLPADYPTHVSPKEEVQNASMSESAQGSVSRSDACIVRPPGLEWPDRAPGIVVRDIVAIRDQPPPPPAEVVPAEPMDMNPDVQPPGMRERLEAAKMVIAGRWLREKEYIVLAHAAMLAKVQPVIETMWQSLAAARREFHRTWGTASRGIVRRTCHFERRVRKITTRASALQLKIDDKKEETESAARELTHELEVTKSTLLAQQQALENVTVQLNAVQKELARHKHMLAALMTQVEAVDLKIVRTLHPPESRKAKSSADPAQPRRASAKKSGLPVEPPREQRV